MPFSTQADTVDDLMRHCLEEILSNRLYEPQHPVCLGLRPSARDMTGPEFASSPVVSAFTERHLYHGSVVVRLATALRHFAALRSVQLEAEPLVHRERLLTLHAEGLARVRDLYGLPATRGRRLAGDDR